MTAFGPKDADAWYERNKHKLGDDDPVMEAITGVLDGTGPITKVFEFGCANGWRLSRIRGRYGSDVWGSEISPKACRDALLDPKVKMNLEPAIGSCDLVIMGFCLYVIQPDSLTYWVHYADKILADGGHIVIWDFLPDHPYSRIFEHNKELRSRKCDHAQLWLAHPAYSLVRRDIYGDGDDRTHVTILRKDMANAFPLMEG